MLEVLTSGLHTRSRHNVPIWLLANPGGALNNMKENPSEEANSKPRIKAERDPDSKTSKAMQFLEMLRSVRDDPKLNYQKDEEIWERIKIWSDCMLHGASPDRRLTVA